jgi:hypothetical protein
MADRPSPAHGRGEGGEGYEEVRCMGGGGKSGPADEFEALRARLLTALRRNPGDTRALMRAAMVLSRMAAAEHRLSPRKREELSANLGAVLSRYRDLIAPADDSGQPRPPEGEDGGPERWGGRNAP